MPTGLIATHHQLSENLWAPSLLHDTSVEEIKRDAANGFLILEGIDDAGKPFMHSYQLVDKNKIQTDLDFNLKKMVGKDCYVYTSTILKENAVLAIPNMPKYLGKESYEKKTIATPKFFSSSEIGSDVEPDTSLTHFQWALKMFRSATQSKTLISEDARRFKFQPLVKHIGDAQPPEPSTGCRIM